MLLALSILTTFTAYYNGVTTTPTFITFTSAVEPVYFDVLTSTTGDVGTYLYMSRQLLHI